MSRFASGPAAVHVPSASSQACCVSWASSEQEAGVRSRLSSASRAQASAKRCWQRPQFWYPK